MNPVLIAGARPNFVKIGPLHKAFRRHGMPVRLVHTGQHYDEAMSGSFFRDLDIPAPDANLGVGSGSHAVQTAAVMKSFDGWLDEHREIDMIVVVGDVNSTLACTLVGIKRGIRIAHVEAGLRSGDRTMPEETNRILVDAVADWLLTPSADADQNLRREGAHASRIQRVGNIMVDSLFDARSRRPSVTTAERLGLTPRGYGLLTLHRPALVDDPDKLGDVLGALNQLTDSLPILFPVHPRTAQMIDRLKLRPSADLHLTGPLGYLDFVACESDAAIVLTDSGGVQEETTCLGVPCLTLRDGTERPVTVTHGTNEVVGLDPYRAVRRAVERLSEPIAERRPDLWDGQTADRVIRALHTNPVFG